MVLVAVAVVVKCVLVDVLSLVMCSANTWDAMVVLALVLVGALINAVTAKVTALAVVLVPPIQVEQNYILSLKNSELKTS